MESQIVAVLKDGDTRVPAAELEQSRHQQRRAFSMEEHMPRRPDIRAAIAARAQGQNT